MCHVQNHQDIPVLSRSDNYDNFEEFLICYSFQNAIKTRPCIPVGPSHCLSALAVIKEFTSTLTVCRQGCEVSTLEPENLILDRNRPQQKIPIRVITDLNVEKILMSRLSVSKAD